VSGLPSGYRNPRSYGAFAAQVVILTAIAWIGIEVGRGGTLSRTTAWLFILVLMIFFAIVAGKGITGYWRGILIDNRNKISLARVQLLVWTLLILSAIVTAGITNGAFGAQSPLSIQVPQELWVLLGISTASAVAAPAVTAGKRDKTPDPTELLNTVSEIQKTDQQVRIDIKHSGVLVRNESPADARWGDLLKGDESGNAATVDLGKLQMFFFTFVLALGYGVAIGRLFDGTGGIASLPLIDSSVNTLLGISHTGYLANKVLPHSREVMQPPAPAPQTASPPVPSGQASTGSPQEAQS
jgi:hypothetical protein